MANKLVINPETWSRREHYDFFGKMDDPFFGISTHADFTRCHAEAKRDNASFFIYSLHKILHAINGVEELKYRNEGDDIVVYDSIGASPTIGREDGSFGFGLFEYHEDRRLFAELAQREIDRVKSTPGLCLESDCGRQDIIYYSSIPWIDFTGLKHAGSSPKGKSVPRISTGRLSECGGRFMMSVSIEVNHGFADGRHVARFLELLNDR